ncbi:MAG TPA: hypothetical protein PKI71_12490, partial [Candidatus Rifleibacterium sp.]|nr:hypothetical protein [Candidatus Rifleibacterium sp.]
MRRHNVLSIAITVLFFFAVSTCADAGSKQRPSKSPQALYKEILLHLDEIEQHNPKAQISVFKTRDALN